MRVLRRAHAAIANPNTRVLVSAASGWEIATEVRLGKLPAASELVDNLPPLSPAAPGQPHQLGKLLRVLVRSPQC
jgi:hypothetical protein